MAKPLRPTSEVFRREDRISKVEFLPIPNVLADYMLNVNTEVLRTIVEDLWDHVVGLLRLEGLKKTHRNNTTGTPATGKLTVLHPGAIADGETFTIYGQVFEFNKSGGVTGGNEEIDISSAETVEDVRIATETAINDWGEVSASPTRVTSPAAGSVGIGGEIDLIDAGNAPWSTYSSAEAQIVDITDTVRDERFTHVGMRSSNPLYASGRITVPAPSAFVDGETLTIPGNGGDPNAVFEFDSNSSVQAGRVAVDLTGITTDAQIRDRLVTGINTKTGDTDVSAAALNLKAGGFLTALHPDLIGDGATFTLDDGANPPKVFEFDKNSNWNPANVRVDISAAADMQDVRAAMIAAINAAPSLTIDAFNRGFGARITLTNATGGSAGNRPVTHTVADPAFLTGDMKGGAAAIKLTTTVSGTVMNRAITDTVASALFVVDGMDGGIGAGWDVTPGHCAFKGYDVVLDKILRLPAVGGVQNFLKVRIRERLLDEDSDFDTIAVSGPGFAVPKPGPNQYRWTPELVIESAAAAAPELEGMEVRIVDGILAEFDTGTGTTLVDEVEVRGTKFGRFLEPQDVTTKVSKVGDTMSGDLLPSVDHLKKLGSALARWQGFFSVLTAEIIDVITLVVSSDATIGALTVLGRLQQKFGSSITVNPSNVITLPIDGNSFPLNFSGNVDFITTTGWQAGAEVLLWVGGGQAITFRHNQGSPPANTAPLWLTGTANLSGGTEDILRLVYNGGHWRQVAWENAP
jgi:hypothetical protein